MHSKDLVQNVSVMAVITTANLNLVSGAGRARFSNRAVTGDDNSATFIP